MNTILWYHRTRLNLKIIQKDSYCAFHDAEHYRRTEVHLQWEYSLISLIQSLILDDLVLLILYGSGVGCGGVGGRNRFCSTAGAHRKNIRHVLLLCRALFFRPSSRVYIVFLTKRCSLLWVSDLGLFIFIFSLLAGLLIPSPDRDGPRPAR
jgi:hypothetical protein